MDERSKMLWYGKIKHQLDSDQDIHEIYRKKAGIMAEFARIICIAYGYYEKGNLITDVIVMDEESELIQSFFAKVEKRDMNEICFAGHNIREFDIPFICRRALINDISLPLPFQLHNKKPWEIKMLDTFQFWRFGDIKQFTSLDLLCHVLKIPSPKQDVDGSMIGSMFWEQDPIQKALNLIKIQDYCLSDLKAIIMLIEKMGISKMPSSTT